MSFSFEKKTFLTVSLIILGLEFTIFFPSFFLLTLFTLTLFLFFALSSILKIKPKEQSLYPIFVLPLVLLVEASIVLQVIPDFSLKHLFVFGFALLLYLVTSSLGVLKSHIISYSLIIFNIITMSFLLAVFFAYVVLYNFYLVFNLPLWITMIAVFFLTSLFFRFNLWKNDLLEVNSKTYSFVLSLILMETFWALSFWPFLALSSGFIIFLVYYIFLDLFNLLLKRSLDKKSLLGQVVVPSVVLVIFLFSMKW